MRICQYLKGDVLISTIGSFRKGCYQNDRKEGRSTLQQLIARVGSGKLVRFQKQFSLRIEEEGMVLAYDNQMLYGAIVYRNYKVISCLCDSAQEGKVLILHLLLQLFNLIPNLVYFNQNLIVLTPYSLTVRKMKRCF